MVREFHDILKDAKVEYSALSWGGFNVFGDKKSIEEVKRLFFEAEKTSHLQDEVKRLRKNDQQ